tara:strand:- start:31565 stop:31879 length:315 start_codon:yes stop_codon:yes gene_type:complete
MKFNYLFVDHNNGHETVYHPFCSNSVISQERVTELLMTIPGAGRSGTHVGQLLELLDQNSIEFGQVMCPCCDKIVHKMASPDFDLWERVAGIKWVLLEGVSGNY